MSYRPWYSYSKTNRRKNSKPSINTSTYFSPENKSVSIFWEIFPTNVWRILNICLSRSCCLSIFGTTPCVGPKWHESRFFHDQSYLKHILSCSKICFIVVHNMFIHNMFNHICNMFHYRALEILKSESVQPMRMTSSMSPVPKKKNMCISPVTKTNDNWQSYNSF